MTIVTSLFDKLDCPDFTGLSADAAWAACEAWEDWAYDNAESFSEDSWDNVVRIMRANYDRYYERYENAQ
jgi:hypothetical protein